MVGYNARAAALAATLIAVSALLAAAPSRAQHDRHGRGASAPSSEGHQGHDMDPLPSGAKAAAKDARGGRLLAPEVIDGVKVFALTAAPIRWSIKPGVLVDAYAYNGQVPGPLLRVTAGDRVRMIVKNDLPEPTSVHWHGIRLPNDQDGAGGVTQPDIARGATFTYEFTVPDAGTYWYHTHTMGERQQPLGLYGALVVDPKDQKPAYDKEAILLLGEWTVKQGRTFPAMDMDGMRPNWFTINGKSYPATEPLKVKVGERVRLRFIGSGQFVHPMHLHGQPFEIVETDGNPVPAPARLRKDTVLVGPGERYDVEFVAERKGRWLLHCHINHHMTNDGREEQGGGGLTLIVEVS
jgi:FtsP/CotA-like multicopper oxidase with cupredoxin domain